jgi:hypothetical protein
LGWWVEGWTVQAKVDAAGEKSIKEGLSRRLVRHVLSQDLEDVDAMGAPQGGGGGGGMMLGESLGRCVPRARGVGKLEL